MKAWEKNIRRVVPYVAGEQPNNKNMIKLNTNECPYPPSPMVEKAKEDFDIDCLRLYPDQNCTAINEALAEYYGIKSDMVYSGVGSDDVLSVVFMTFFNSNKPILFPEITYSFYPVWSELYKIPYETIPLDNNYHIVKENYYKENGGVIFPNPNAPTALYEDLSVVEDIIKHNQDVVVVVDEAYIDFGGKSALELVEKYDNLLVVQTFSKSRAMAGIRIGYAMGNSALIKAMNDVKFSINSYTLNQTSLKMGVAAIKDDEYFHKITEKIIATRERSKEELAKLGFNFPDSKANFIFASHEKYSANEIFMFLRKKDIFVRHWNTRNISNSLRITIGTDEQMDRLFEAIREFIQSKN